MCNIRDKNIFSLQIGNSSTFNEALQLVKSNGYIGTINFYDIEDTFTVPTFLTGLGMADINIRGGFCPGGALRAEKLLKLIQNDRIHPGKTFNYEFHGFWKNWRSFQTYGWKTKRPNQTYHLHRWFVD